MSCEKIATFIYDSEARGVTGRPKWEYDRVMAHRDWLARALGEQGVRLAIARMARKEGTFQAHRSIQPVFLDDGIVDKEQTTAFEPVELDSLGDVVLDRWSENYGKGLEGIDTPIINELAVQQYGEDKLKAYQEVLHPLGIAVPTFDLHELDEKAFPPELENTPYGIYLKPIGGALSEGLIRYDDLPDLQCNFAALYEAGKRYIVQPGYDFSQPWTGIRPYSLADEPEFTRRNQLDTPKELRTYCFYGKDTGLHYFPVGRATDQGNQYMQIRHRFFIDPESLPTEVEVYTKSIVAKLTALTHARGIFIAIDFGYGIKPGEQTAQWLVQEVNTRFPFLDFFGQHKVIGNKIANMFARQIAQMTI